MQFFDSPENLLFTDNEGQQGQFQDIVAEGLDGGYEERIPKLIDLLGQGEPYYCLLACAMLTAWGQPSGFQKLIDWAYHPDNVPWQESSVAYERLYGADSAFELLADAVKTSFFCDSNEMLRQLQRDAIKALLSIYDQYFFGRTLALAIIKHEEILASVQTEIKSAIELSIKLIQKNISVGFDLDFQVACLLIPLALLDDEATASYAQQLISEDQRTRVLQEIINALANGKGSATLSILHEMRKLNKPSLEIDIKNELTRRGDT